MGEAFAAIDCGTNAIRLLIAERTDAGFCDLVREMRTVRLGEGVDASGEFTPAALTRTFEACAEYAGLISAHPVRAVRFVATSAAREVSNRGVFLAGVQDRLGVVPEVIDGLEEAELSFRGAVQGLPAVRMPALVVDIGGGSTEFVLGDGSRIGAAVSTPIGCVRITERLLHTDPPTSAEVDRARQAIRAALQPVQESVDVRGCGQFIGVAGSVTTVVALALGLPRYDAATIHAATVSRTRVAAVTEMLLAATRAERAAMAVMHPGRVDVIGGGALVLDEVMAAFDVPEVTASEADLLDGIVDRLATDPRCGSPPPGRAD